MAFKPDIIMKKFVEVSNRVAIVSREGVLSNEDMIEDI
jgi:hypothetical protein